MSNVRNNLEIDNLKLKEVISKMNYELNSYKEANERYENLLKNNNEINIVYKNNISKEE